MFSFGLSISSFNQKQKQRELTPKQFLFRLGQCCKFCNKKIVYSNSMCICQCKQYGHLQCTKKFLNAMAFKQGNQIKCQKCKKNIQLTYERWRKLGLHIRLQNSILIVFVCIALVFIIESITEEFGHKPAQRNLISLSFEILISVLLFITLMVLIVLSLFKDEFKIKDIKKSRNSVIVSAFEGVLTPRDQQNSSNIIFT